MKSSIIKNLAYALRKNSLETKLKMKMETMEYPIKIFHHKQLSVRTNKNSLENKLEMKTKQWNAPLKSSIISNLAYVLGKNSLETKLEMKMETMECTNEILHQKQLSVRTKKK